ncbi:MAG: hypothetical protein ACI9QL_005438 [Candidatus Omnitrophota bacterium]|jgi:hypothetical protein
MNYAPWDIAPTAFFLYALVMSKTAKLPTGATAEIPRTGGSIYVEGSGGAHEIKPPKNAVFYCFHKEPRIGLCVVVTYSPQHKIDNRRDWIFTVNWETGELKRLRPWA